MARTQQIDGRAPARPSVDLERMISRLQQTLLLPDSSQEARLRRSRYERERVGYNLEYARSLLLQLEQEAQGIKIQTRKQELQKSLVEKGEQLRRFSERLQELDELGDAEDFHNESSEGEDILGELTPSDTTDEQPTPTDNPTPEISASPPIPVIQAKPVPPSDLSSQTTNTLRSRNPRTELFTSSTGNSYLSPSSPKPMNTAKAETLLTHNRAEQESLTTSLLAMATALKNSSQAFATSLDDEKAVLEGAVEGIDKNESGLQAAQKRMGLLRRYSEGKGWWGRIILYAWIGGLWVVAVLVVFGLPKLRF